MRADAARRGRSRVPAGAADQRRGPALPGRRRGRAASSPRTRRGRRRSPSELSRANAERRATEREVDAAAEAARRELPEELREAPALVVAGEGWHPGVVGIVASRLVERHHRPAIVISLDGEGDGRGSGRSIPGFDLLAGARGLRRAPGRASAATAPRPGWSCEAESLEAFREAFAAHADRGARPGGPAADRADRRDGRRRRPRPRPRRGARPAGPVRDGQPGRAAAGPRRPGSATCGRWGRASTRASASTAARTGRSASPSAAPSLGVGDEDPVDAAVRLEVNHWNGAVEPRVVLRELYPLEAARRGAAAHACECEPRSGGSASRPSWPPTRRVAAALERAPGGRASGGRVVARGGLGDGGDRRARLQRRRRCWRSAPTPRAARRWPPAPRAGPLQRRRGADRLHRCGAGRSRPGGTASGARADRLRRARAEPELAPAFEHVVLVDPPPSPRALAPAARPARRRLPAPRLGRGRACASRSRRSASSSASRAARSPASSATCARPATASGEELREALRGGGAAPARPRGGGALLPRPRRARPRAGRRPTAARGVVGVVSSEGTDLERSAAFRAYSARLLRRASRYLERPKQP